MKVESPMPSAAQQVNSVQNKQAAAKPAQTQQAASADYDKVTLSDSAKAMMAASASKTA